MTKDDTHLSDNGPILTIAQLIKVVMSSAAEAEIGALFINAREAVHIRNILGELGHEQPPTPIQTDNATAESVVNGRGVLKQTKAMDMRFHWLRCRMVQGQFRFFWRPGPSNKGDYHTKHFAGSYHRSVRPERLTPQSYLDAFRARIAQISTDVRTNSGEDPARVC